MRAYRIIILLLIFCLAPLSGYAQVYHYIDKDGVERYSNQPPPEGAKIIGESKEIEYDKAADSAQQERNREAAAEAEKIQSEIESQMLQAREALIGQVDVFSVGLAEKVLGRSLS